MRFAHRIGEQEQLRGVARASHHQHSGADGCQPTKRVIENRQGAISRPVRRHRRHAIDPQRRRRRQHRNGHAIAGGEVCGGCASDLVAQQQRTNRERGARIRRISAAYNGSRERRARTS